MAFHGIVRTCKRYKKVPTVRGKELRCAEYKKGRGMPPATGKALRGTGRGVVCRHPAGPYGRTNCYVKPATKRRGRK